MTKNKRYNKYLFLLSKDYLRSEEKKFVLLRFLYFLPNFFFYTFTLCTLTCLLLLSIFQLTLVVFNNEVSEAVILLKF